MSAPGLVWFRRDLRLSDNPAWAAATASHRDVVALFVADPRLLAAANARCCAKTTAAKSSGWTSDWWLRPNNSLGCQPRDRKSVV